MYAITFKVFNYFFQNVLPISHLWLYSHVCLNSTVLVYFKQNESAKNRTETKESLFYATRSFRRCCHNLHLCFCLQIKKTFRCAYPFLQYWHCYTLYFSLNKKKSQAEREREKRDSCFI